MSKASEIAGYWAMSKKAMLIGLGYFAATNPRGTAKFLLRVGPPLFQSMARDTLLIAREAGKELIKPAAKEAARDAARIVANANAAASRPMIWGGLAQPTFILMGGALAHNFATGAEVFLDLFDIERWPGETEANLPL